MRRIQLLIPLAVALRAFAASGGDYVHSTVGDSQHWTALNWSADDIALFNGMPAYSGPDKHVLLVRYSFFVSAYDTDKFSPLWVAHVDEADSEKKDTVRKKGHWDRKGDTFKPDENVVTYSQAQNIHWVTDHSFLNANPASLPAGEHGYAKITRGHMASNQEMKSLGDDDQGERSQSESFSLANVVPQMQHHNSPIWETLEVDCIKWATLTGRVAVISGPVYAPDPSLPPPANKLIFTADHDGVAIPIPTHIFKVIIGMRDGKLSAIGFLVPHRADLSVNDLKKFVVPVRKIEELTKLNFMPTLGHNDALEKKSDPSWLALIP